jgi:hypothetical protein
MAHATNASQVKVGDAETRSQDNTFPKVSPQASFRWDGLYSVRLCKIMYYSELPGSEKTFPSTILMLLECGHLRAVRDGSSVHRIHATPAGLIFIGGGNK